MAESIMPEFKAVDPRAYLAPKIRRAGEAIGSIFHMMPDTPLASHGDHMPSWLEQPQPQDDQLQLDLDQ